MNTLEIDLKKLRENDIPTAAAVVPPQPLRVYLNGVLYPNELDALILTLTTGERSILLEYVKKLIESRPK